LSHLGPTCPPMAFSVEAPPTNWLPAVIASLVVFVGLALYLIIRGRK